MYAISHIYSTNKHVLLALYNPILFIRHFLYYLLKMYVYFIRFTTNDGLSTLQSTHCVLDYVKQYYPTHSLFCCKSNSFWQLFMYWQRFFLFSFIWIIESLNNRHFDCISLLWTAGTGYDKLIMLKSWIRIKHTFIFEQTRTSSSCRKCYCKERPLDAVIKFPRLTWILCRLWSDSIDSNKKKSQIVSQMIVDFFFFKFNACHRFKCVYLII